MSKLSGTSSFSRVDPMAIVKGPIFSYDFKDHMLFNNNSEDENRMSKLSGTSSFSRVDPMAIVKGPIFSYDLKKHKSQEILKQESQKESL